MAASASAMKKDLTIWRAKARVDHTLVSASLIGAVELCAMLPGKEM
jgi:hypothetical protein